MPGKRGFDAFAADLRRTLDREQFRQVRRAALTGQRLDDPVLAAAAERFGAANLRNSALFAPGLLAVAAMNVAQPLVTGAPVERPALLAVAVAGVLLSIVLLLLSRRAVRVHAGNADRPGLQSLLARHDPGARLRADAAGNGAGGVTNTH